MSAFIDPETNEDESCDCCLKRTCQCDRILEEYREREAV